MKKIIYFLALTALFTACKPKATLNTDKEVVSLTDSSFYNSSYLSDTGAVADPDEFINSGGVVSGKSTVPDAKSNTARNSNTRSSNNTRTSSSSGNNQSSGNTSAPATTQRRGISKAAKGAIIGGVGGAVAGAVIGKNAKGAGVGAVVGAAGGYIIGRSKDRRDGRVRN